MPVHNIQPIFDSHSQILILGSFPSVKSREGEFFYDHPQNRFWRVMAAVLECPVPVTHEQKRVFLLSHGIALWDVIASCEISGSSDSSIKNAVPNDLSRIILHSNVKAVFCNGGTAFKFYEKYSRQSTGMPAMKLPSTSPANAVFSIHKLSEEWRAILPYLL